MNKDKKLDKEAIRIMKKILTLYLKKIEVNTLFENLVSRYIRIGYRKYKKDIVLRCISLIPNGLYIDISGKYSLLNQKDFYKTYKSLEKK